jgi:hypothetical protein
MSSDASDDAEFRDGADDEPIVELVAWDELPLDVVRERIMKPAPGLYACACVCVCVCVRVMGRGSNNRMFVRVGGRGCAGGLQVCMHVRVMCASYGVCVCVRGCDGPWVK